MQKPPCLVPVFSNTLVGRLTAVQDKHVLAAVVSKNARPCLAVCMLLQRDASNEIRLTGMQCCLE